MRWFSKRGLLVFAAIALFIPVLAACNGDDDDTDTTDDTTVEDVEEDDPADDPDDATVDEEDDATVDEEDDAAVDEEDDPAVDEEDDATVDEDDDAAVDEEDDATVDEEDDEAANGADIELDGEITLTFIEGWDEGVAHSYLWGAILENHGMTVNFEPMADAGILYEALSAGDIDVYSTAWLPLTHADYWDSYGDQLESLNVWYDEAVLALSVPQYVVDEHGIESLEDLADNADLFDSTITGIEAGAGMMGIAAEDVMPGYGIDDWELLESSTAAMITEWETAVSAEEPIVVTLWEPHWMYAEYDVHNLEDPEGTWGELDGLETIAWDGFSDEFPEVAEMMADTTLTSEEIGELMDYVTVQAEDGEQLEYAQQWLDDGGQEIVDGWLN